MAAQMVVQRRCGTQDEHRDRADTHHGAHEPPCERRIQTEREGERDDEDERHRQHHHDDVRDGMNKAFSEYATTSIKANRLFANLDGLSYLFITLFIMCA